MRHRNPDGAILLSLGVLAGLLVACHEAADPMGPSGTLPQPRMILEPEVVTLAPGERIQLDPLFLDEGWDILPEDPGLIWRSSDEAVVRPLGEGWVEALKGGDAMVRVVYKGWRAEARVRVTPEGRLAWY